MKKAVSRQRRSTGELPIEAPAEAVAGDTAYHPPLTISNGNLLTKGRDGEFRSAVYLMNMVLSKLQTCRDGFGSALDLTGTQFAVLMGVAHQQKDVGVTIRTLAKHLSIAAPHVTTEVGRLVDMQLLVKSRHEEDRRSVLIQLTAEGQRHIDKVSPLVLKVNDQLFNGVTTAEFKAMVSCFEKVARNSELAIAELKIHRMQSTDSWI